jgi:lipopolysaccharide/colanic/teichoic acid biosynthesis glycosyltransferase
MKRLIDFLLAFISLIVFSPLFLICYIAIRIEDGKPVFFKQQRIGRKAKPFYIYKFRSLTVEGGNEENLLIGEIKKKELTRIGKFLRAHHLDELPQLWNVLIGDMAFVGPRPERKYYIDMIIKYDPRYELLYKLRPGVTSYATLHNGYTDTMEKMLIRLEMDLEYLERQSLMLDAKILLETFTNIIIGKKF